MLSFRSLERADFREGFFLFFWMMDFSLFRLLSSFSRSFVRKKEFFTCAVCDHRAFAPREAPRIAKSKRVILISSK